MSKKPKCDNKDTDVDLDAILRRPSIYDDNTIAELAKLSALAYARRRKQEAEKLGVGVGQIDQAVREQRRQSAKQNATLPHWEVEPWPGEVSGGELLDNIKAEFKRFIVLPAGAADFFSLWVLHAWTFDAGDISPFLVLVSPEKRCGKTSVLIILQYLTPKSELASNISASALFRYVEDIHPTLLIDEADSFLKKNDEMRGILNSGHTKTAAYVIRNVEVEGEHKPKRFSTWAPKAIATIRSLADTLEDRAIVVQLQRKPKSAKVERLRKRDSEDFAVLRRKAARWAADNFEELADPDPQIPDALNDRAADNWRPLLAIADIASDDWPRRAREAACTLSGEGHDAPSISVELLADIRRAFADKEPAVRSVDLVARLIADPERPWVEWKRGKPITPKQLGHLLRPFNIISETVSIGDLADAKGYKRARFEDVWERYLPGQTPSPTDFPLPKRRNVVMPMASAQHDDFGNVAEPSGDGSKNDELSYSHAGSDVSTFRKPKSGRADELTTPDEAPDDTFGATPDTGSDDVETAPAEFGSIPKATRAQVEPPAPARRRNAEGNLEIPPFLDRRPQPRQDGKWAGSYLSDDDDAFIASGKFK